MKSTFWHTLKRSQIAAIAATILDFGTLVGLVQWFGVWYVAATAWGAFNGAVTNFWINRQWSFEAIHAHWGPQGVRYILVSVGSLGLNTLGVYAFTDGLGFHYSISKLFIAVGVGLLFNYPLHRYYVFRPQPE